MPKDSFLALKKKKAIQYYSENNIDKAEKYLIQVCKKSKQDAEAWFLLGLIFGQKGNHPEAEKHFRHVIFLAPDVTETYVNLAVSLNIQSKYKECVALLEKYQERYPDDLDALTNISIALLALKKPEPAIEYATRAASLDHNNPAIHELLASAYGMRHLTKEAIKHFEIALKLDHKNLTILSNYAKFLFHANDYESCIKICQKTLAIDSSFLPAQKTLSSALLHKGEIKATLNEIINTGQVNTDYLFYLNYDESISAQESFLAHKKWGEDLAYPKTQQHNIKNCVATKKPMRIGYISPDFRQHSVAFFLEPLLQNHDKNSFEIFCYANVKTTDDVTERFKSYTTHWRDIYPLDTKQIVKQINKDKIDILVDLAGHTPGNNIKVLAEKPAPIQITYLGYPSTTGLKTIDYRLVDNNTDPLELEKYATEKLLRVPDCFLCYSNTARPTARQTKQDDTIVFGSFNHLPKINDQVISAWASILEQTLGASLILKNRSFADNNVCEKYLQRFEHYGISRNRITLLGKIKNMDEHLLYYNKVDIALDTFPYNGTTTTCEALWMNVPVICFVGDRHASRVSSSILRTIGLDQLIANDLQEYVEKAVTLAKDMKQLSIYHRSIRNHMLDSALCDSKSFTTKIEDIYKKLILKD